MEHESNIQKLDFAVLVPQAQRGDSRAVNSLLLGFTPMVRAFKYNSYYVHYLEQDDTEILALMAVNDAIKSFKQHNFHFFATHVKYTIRRQLNIQVQKKKNRFDAELATLDEEGCTSLDALSSECYKERTSRDAGAGGTAAADATACDQRGVPAGQKPARGCGNTGCDQPERVLL